ncbi:MAG: hypothetical protein RhofKO_06700 [Rhodothermales bacterium]
METSADLPSVPPTPWVGVGIGVFVALFLLVFRPFGLPVYGWSDAAFWLILGLIPLNAALVIGMEMLLARGQQRWGWMGHKTVDFSLTLMGVVLGNVLYQVLLQGALDVASIARFGGHVLLVASLPAGFLLLWLHARSSPAGRVEASKPESFTLADEAGRETLTLHTDDLLYIQSDRNYVLIHTRTAAQPHVLRTSLKAVETQLSDRGVVRCHRSYLVNTAHIEQHQRRARGGQLTLRATAITLPVSASFAKVISQHLQAQAV